MINSSVGNISSINVLNESHIGFLETGAGCLHGSTSLSINDRKYLIIGGILLFLLLVWSVIFYMQEKKKKNTEIDESALSRLISRKLGQRGGKEAHEAGINHVTVNLQPMISGLPIFTVDNSEKIVGRSRSAAFHLDNTLVSGKHLSLMLNANNEILVKDLGSSNGTFISNVPPFSSLLLGSSETLMRASCPVPA